MIKKICNKCNQKKPLTEFYKDKTKRDGIHTICKSCCIQNTKEYYKINKEMIRNKKKEYDKSYYCRPKVKQHRKEYLNRYNQDNKEKINEYRREYRKRPYVKEKTKIYYDKHNKIYYQQNKETIILQQRKYNQIPIIKNKHRTYSREYYRNNKERINQKTRENYQKLENKEKIKKYKSRPEVKLRIKKYLKNYHKYYQCLPETKINNRIAHKKYYQKPIVQERIKQYSKKYNHRREVKQRIRDYRKNKIKNDLNYKIKTYLRNGLYRALKRNIKYAGILELIGCSIPELKQHLKNQFTFGMNWKNYGYGWHIDHIRPCKSFDLSKEEEQKKCFHYLNLQPLWALENFKKNGKQ